MLHLHRRKLSAAYALGPGVVWFFCVSTDARMHKLVTAAKLKASVPAFRAMRRVYDEYLQRYFPGFRVTVPRGEGPDSLMYRLWRDDARFLACFDHEMPLNRRHHWAARLHGHARVEVTAGVAGQRLVLVDDVVTTGTTLATHLVSLLEAGAQATAMVLTYKRS